jgi:hypothetical protein
MSQGTMTNTGEVKKKKGFWGKFLTFLMMGGWILMIVVILAIVVAISVLFK